MLCPACSRPVKDGSAICPSCDAILDESILGPLPTDTDDEDTPLPGGETEVVALPPVSSPLRPGPAAPRPMGPPSARRPRAASRSEPAWAEEPASPVRAPAEPLIPRSLPGGETALTPKGDDPFEQLRELGGFFLGLHFEDKLTAVAASLLFLMSAMPWRSTLEGDEDVGFATWGLLTALLGAASLASIWARSARRWRWLPAAHLPLVAVGSGALAALVALAFVIGCYAREIQYGRPVVTAWPAFGVYLSLACAVGVVVGGLLTWRRERKA